MCGVRVHWMLRGPFYVLSILVLRFERVIEELSECLTYITLRFTYCFVEAYIIGPCIVLITFFAWVLRNWLQLSVGKTLDSGWLFSFFPFFRACGQGVEGEAIWAWGTISYLRRGVKDIRRVAKLIRLDLMIENGGKWESVLRQGVCKSFAENLNGLNLRVRYQV